MRAFTRGRLFAVASILTLAAAACAPETPKPTVAEKPAAPHIADPGATSLTMAADPAKLGFEPAVFEKARAGLEADVKAGVIPGAVLLIARGGQVVNLTTVGTEGPGDADIVTPETVFRIYSMSKPIVSVAAMQLVEEGKLALEDPISKYIPEFANPKVLVGAGKTRPAAREVTVRDLMSHESGLIYGVFDQESELGKMYMAAGDTRSDFTALDLSKALAALPLAFDPGSAWRYSRSTDVLGAVLEKASGKTLDVLLDEKIFTPLGMNDTHFYLEPDEVSRLAEPPTTITPLSKPQEKQAMLSGGGGLNSTTEDYFRFVEMLRNRGEYRGVRIIKPSTLDAMLVDQIGPDVDRSTWFYPMPGAGFGLGFGLLPIDFKDPSKGNVFSWSGYAGTNMWVDPKNDITMVFMIQNNEAADDYPEKLREWVYGGFKAPTAPAPAAPATASEGQH
jgi:CubicO group peptidase (beta-lactamase class C family)